MNVLNRSLLPLMPAIFLLINIQESVYSKDG